jgi:2'-5' RNA ligase
MPTDATADRLRLFIALTVPPAVKANLHKAQEELGASLQLDTVRWAKPQQFHLTLRFLGSVESTQLQPLVEALRAATAGFSSLNLRAAGIGFFPRKRSPRVIWAGVSDEQNRLRELHRAVQAATDVFTAEKPEDMFTGHITIGRVKMISRPEAEALAEAGEGMQQCLFGNWVANAVEIVRSQLSPHGSRYSTVGSAALAAD